MKTDVDVSSTQIIALDPEKYVAAVFAPFRERLDAAKSAAKDIAADVGTKEGMAVAIKQRAVFRSLRVEVEAARKTRKAPILEISRLLDGRAKAITEEIEPDEGRFDTAIKAEETRKERERAEREAAEAARLAAIQACMAEIVAKPGTLVGKPSSAIAVALDDMRAHDVTTWAQEQTATAEDVKARAVAALEQLHAGAVAQEEAAKAEAARILAEREELVRLRAEQQEREREEKRLMEAAMARRREEERIAREKIEAEQREARARIEAEEKAARLAREEADRKAADERAVSAAKAQAEQAASEAQERQERAAREAEARRQAEAQAERERALREEQARVEADRREIARQQEEMLATDRLIAILAERIKGQPKYAGIAKAIAAYQAAKEKAA